MIAFVMSLWPRCLLERCITLFYIWIYLFFLFTWMLIQVLIWVIGLVGLISDSSWWFLFGPFCSCKFILAQIINYLDMWEVIWDESIVFKPGPARRVDLRPGRPGHGTRQGGGQNPLGNWPGQTRSTWWVDPGPSPPGQTRVRPDHLFFYFPYH